MGGDGQPQTHLQVLTNIIDFGMNIQDAIEAPRWVSSTKDNLFILHVEGRIPLSVREALLRKGHEINVLSDWHESMGHAQGITIDQKTGVLTGGADPRGDGVAIGI
jgi:gamma-glutamyltranspeptidase/glutathione hydrolase